ncbi:ISAzo13-like element transposase-related protein [Azohydromonas australica]|uniref:ISAzo13-like element transposase-related protein n=1 Tax=Azohydromonas australica TaxID=364039 RepID=UPI0009FD9254|nr:hypothetical protein [Azohydromonas australica]
MRPYIHVCQCPECLSQADGPTCALHQRVNLFLSRLDEQQRRWYAALQAQELGHGGERLVAKITGVSEKTIRRGRSELDAELADRPVGRVRQAGGGRPFTEEHDPQIEQALERILESETAGDPQRRTKFKRSSLRQLSARLRQGGHSACPTTVSRLLRKLGYSPKVNARRKEAKASPEQRDEQFRHIEQQKQAFLAAGEPIISVDTKKKGAHR